MKKNISSLVCFKNVVSAKFALSITLFAVLLLPSTSTGQQCSPDLLQGRDLVRNGNFSQNYADWTYTADSDGLPNANPKGYIIFNPPATQNYSVPGFIYAGSTPTTFNSAFGVFNDHTPGSTDNKMLMVDGVCEPGIKLWSQNNIPITANTRYYFSVWIHALKDNNNPPGTLQFEIEINGAPYSLSNVIQAPSDLATGWFQVEAEWDSPVGLPVGTIGSISIENTTITGCDQFVDFAIDDISFIPGCKYADASTSLTPDLGLDQTICGKGGAAITLGVTDDGIADVAGNEIWWSDNVGNGTGGAGAGEFTRTITPNSASLPITLAVCTKVGTGCKKTDVITITGDYTIDLDDLTLCSPPSATLDAGFSGTGVTYQWYSESNGTAGWQAADTIPASKAKTLFVNTKGTYRVVVNDPACGIRESQATISSTAPTPKNEYFCNPGNVTLSVSPANSGKYKWWNHPTATAAANLKQRGGNTFTFAASGTSDYTFYAQDTTSFVATVSPNYSTTTFTNPSNDGIDGLYFTALQANFKITGLTLVPYVYSHPTNISVTFDLIDVSNGNANLGSYTTVPVPSIAAQQGPFPNSYAVTFATPITVPTTGNYLLKKSGGDNIPQFDGAAWPYTYPSIISITGNNTGDAAKKNKYPAIFSWVISAGTPCDRVPVQAIYNCTLAATLLDFSVSSSANVANVTWTALENGESDHYEVLRSHNGHNFESIASIKTKGLSTSNNYVYTDPLGEGNTYYQLAQYDKSGAVYYSKIISVSYEGLNLTVFPNPTLGTFRVSFRNEIASSIKLNLFNNLGTSVYSKQVLSDDIDFTEDIDINHLPKGIYILSIEGSEHAFVKLQKE